MERLRIVEFRELKFLVPEDVYLPSDDSLLLAENFKVRDGEEVLEIGCGCGINALLAALRAGRVVATDINPSAAKATLWNARLNGLNGKVEVLVGDLFGPIGVGEVFDVILFNPPYLPSTPEEGCSILEKSWQGGESGREVVDRFLEEVGDHLKKDGRIYLVQSTLSRIDETVKRLEEKGYWVRMLGETRFPFETIVCIEARRRLIFGCMEFKTQDHL
ncbi:MAG: class I SAM-dependent methyltransferase [Candidatus Bathyarchaeia archaeon]